MGLLSKGTPLRWEDSLPHHSYVKAHGVLQFLNIYRAQKNRNDDQFLWGDEVEHLLLRIDARKKKVQLALRADEIIDALEQQQQSGGSGSHSPPSEDQQQQGQALSSPSASLPKRRRQGANFLPEYGRFMIEATPSRPYGGYTADLRMVEANMRARRRMIEKLLSPSERLLTLTSFPLLGVGDFAYNYSTDDKRCQAVQGAVADSDYIPDDIIATHPRFATLTRNIRTRRGARVDIRVPLWKDKNTEARIEEEKKKEAARLEELARTRSSSLPPHMPRPTDLDEQKQIHMDAMAFGMGCCCLQVTFQTRSITEARRLYDHLAAFSPIMLALTASSPFWRGRIADIDARWTVISQSVDDRTPVERGEATLPDGSYAEERNLQGEAPAQLPFITPASSASSSSSSPTPQRLYKSRYDSISTYLSQDSDFHPKYNDIPCEVDPASYELLRKEGVDEKLARHISHLFVRDPLVIYDENILLDDQQTSEHFENLQSTNWQTVRFKPPTPGSSIGWRVEFRTMEVQLTDFENAAFTVFIALLSRALLYFNLNFYLPLSKVDENLARAHRKDAVLEEKFFWRKRVKLCRSNKSGAASMNPSRSASPAPMDQAAVAADLDSVTAAAAPAFTPASSLPPSTSSSLPLSNPTPSSFVVQDEADDEDAYEEMSIRDIMLGTAPMPPPQTGVDSTASSSSSSSASSSSPSSPPPQQLGLLNLVRTYLDMINCDAPTRKVVDAYLDLIAARCSGQLMTGAAWLRKFVEVHPCYEQDSMLKEEIVFDLIETCNQMAKGTIEVPQLLGEFAQHAYGRKHAHVSTASQAGGEEAATATVQVDVAPVSNGTNKAAAPASSPSGSDSDSDDDDLEPELGCVPGANCIELKGAPVRRSASADSLVTSDGEPVGHSLDLDEEDCCEKLRIFLTPYLQQANSVPSTPLKQQLGQFSQSANSIHSMVSTPNPSTSASPAPFVWSSPPLGEEQA